jgi:hypothetical protein
MTTTNANQIKVQSEGSEGLTNDEVLAVRAALNGCRQLASLDEVEANLRALFRGWFVYRGGSHVALHRTAGDDRRVLLVTEMKVSNGGRRYCW